MAQPQLFLAVGLLGGVEIDLHLLSGFLSPHSQAHFALLKLSAVAGTRRGERGGPLQQEEAAAAGCSQVSPFPRPRHEDMWFLLEAESLTHCEEGGPLTIINQDPLTSK